jgi:hypothetical protein
MALVDGENDRAGKRSLEEGTLQRTTQRWEREMIQWNSIQFTIVKHSSIHNESASALIFPPHCLKFRIPSTCLLLTDTQFPSTFTSNSLRKAELSRTCLVTLHICLGQSQSITSTSLPTPTQHSTTVSSFITAFALSSSCTPPRKHHTLACLLHTLTIHKPLQLNNSVLFQDVASVSPDQLYRTRDATEQHVQTENRTDYSCSEMPSLAPLPRSSSAPEQA